MSTFVAEATPSPNGTVGGLDALEPTSREWALVILVVVFVGYAMRAAPASASLKDLPQSFLNREIVVPIVGYAAYLGVWIWLAATFGIWEFDLLKDSVVWFVFGGVPLLFKVGNAFKDSAFLRGAARSTVEFSAFAGFIVNRVTFGIGFELILLTFLVLTALLAAVAATRAEYERLRKPLEAMLAMASLALVSYAIGDTIRDWGVTDAGEFARSLAMTIWLPLVALPYVFGFATVCGYKAASSNMRIASGADRIGLWQQLATMVSLRWNWQDASELRGERAREIATAPTYRTARLTVSDYLADRRQKNADELHQRQRLNLLAGLEGVDAQGRKLDQREFNETTDALRRLASLHVGWYRNREPSGRYKTDVLGVVKGGPHRDRPEFQQIEMEVSPDGQSWYAWRRTVSGWVFAIGASGPPPDQWRYDGPNPPTGFPGSAPGWAHFGGKGAENWQALR